MSSVRFRSIRNCPSEPVNLCTVSIRSSRQIWLLPSKSRNKDSHYNYCLRVVKISMYMNAWCWLWHVIKGRIKMRLANIYCNLCDGNWIFFWLFWNKLRLFKNYIIVEIFGTKNQTLQFHKLMLHHMIYFFLNCTLCATK